MTNKGINLFRVIFVFLVCVVAFLSFFHCIVCIEQGSVEMDLGDGPFTPTHKTDRFFNNARWLMLALSILLLILLNFKRKVTRNICEAVSLVMALVTTVYPVYLSVVYPGFIGNSYGYVWTPIGYVTLALSWTIFLYNAVVLRMIDKKKSHLNV